MKLCDKSSPIKEHEWYPWYAWRPVFAGRCLVWLEIVERKLDCGYDGCDYTYRRLSNGEG